MSAMAAVGQVAKIPLPDRPPGAGGAERVAHLQEAALVDRQMLEEEGTLYLVRCDVCGTNLPFPGLGVMLAYRRYVDERAPLRAGLGCALHTLQC